MTQPEAAFRESLRGSLLELAADVDGVAVRKFER